MFSCLRDCCYVERFDLDSVSFLYSFSGERTHGIIAPINTIKIRDDRINVHLDVLTRHLFYRRAMTISKITENNPLCFDEKLYTLSQVDSMLTRGSPIHDHIDYGFIMPMIRFVDCLCHWAAYFDRFPEQLAMCREKLDQVLLPITISESKWLRTPILAYTTWRPHSRNLDNTVLEDFLVKMGC